MKQQGVRRGSFPGLGAAPSLPRISTAWNTPTPLQAESCPCVVEVWYLKAKSRSDVGEGGGGGEVRVLVCSGFTFGEGFIDFCRVPGLGLRVEG